VDAVALAEDVRLHARVPTMGLVAKMRASIDQLVHGDDRCRHNSSPSGLTSGNQEPENSLKGVSGTGYVDSHVEWARLTSGKKQLQGLTPPLNENIKGTGGTKTVNGRLQRHNETCRVNGKMESDRPCSL
jgi:hypothetical protein